VTSREGESILNYLEVHVLEQLELSRGIVTKQKKKKKRERREGGRKEGKEGAKEGWRDRVCKTPYPSTEKANFTNC